MPYLSYISDETLIQIVSKLLDKASHALLQAQNESSKNVIDPFAVIFEMAGFGLTLPAWIQSETARQAQKTLSNHVGNLHQEILGSVDGWCNLKVGKQVDLECGNRKLIAEVKNKHNTVTGGKLSDLYREMENLVNPKASHFKGYTCYFVHIVPKSSKRYDRPFTPSDKSKGLKCEKNELIREIDGYSFYSLVTGNPDALSDLFKVLPAVIEKCSKLNYTFNNLEPGVLQQYFAKAYNC
jgi:hypothetical protein